MTAPAIEVTVADRVVEALLAGVTDDLVALYRPDALLDVIVPTWRFQLQGHDAVRHVLDEEEFLPGRRVGWCKRTDTSDGVLVELETWAPIGGEERKWLALHHFRLDGVGIVEHVLYCSGVWSAATIARNAVEAPMVRPR